MAIDYFQESARQDEAFAPAYSGLADCYNLVSVYSRVPPAESYPRARELAERAIALDDNLAEAHASLGCALMRYYWAWADARRELERAIQLDPTYATAHHWYGELLMLRGDFDGALRELGIAESLDPLSPAIRSDTAWCLYNARRYDEGAERCVGLLDRNAAYTQARLCLASIYLEQRRFADAEQVLEPYGFAGTSLAVAARVGSGERERGRVLLGRRTARYPHGPWAAFDAARVSVALGDRDAALAWLARSVEDHEQGCIHIRVEPAFDTIREDPRFVELLKHVGLDDGT